MTFTPESEQNRYMVLSLHHRFLPLRHVLVLIGAAGFAWLGAPAPAQEPARVAVAPFASKSPSPPLPKSETVALRRAALPGPFPSEVLHILDGDTFEARVRVWFGQEITTLVRIRGIDAPELKGRCGDELRGAMASRDALAKLLASGSVMLRDVNLDKYGGRVVASVEVRGTGPGEDVSATMIASGWARPYGGGKREAWCPLVPAPRG